jgi:hypothetical protein
MQRISLLLVLFVIFPLSLCAFEYSGGTFDAIFTDGQDVVLQFRDYSTVSEQPVYRVLFFKPDGAFEREITLTIQAPREALFALLGATPDHLFGQVQEWDSDTKSSSTTFYEFDEQGREVQKRKMDGLCKGRVDLTGNLYVSCWIQTELSIDVVNFHTGKSIPYAKFEIKAADHQAVADWVITAAGGVCILRASGPEGVTRCYARDGKLLWDTSVTAEPITGSARLIALQTDSTSNVYVVHYDQNEPVGNDGSILKLDAKGKHVFRIAQKFNFLDGIAVTATGQVFVSTTSGLILRFGKDARLQTKWNAVPPHFGETWKEKFEREQQAMKVNQKSSTEDLLLALTYGDDAIKEKSSEWLQQRGDVIIDAVMDEYDIRPSEEIGGLLDKLLKNNPERVKDAIAVHFHNASTPLKKILVGLMMYSSDSALVGIKEFVFDLAESSDDSDRYFAHAAMMRYRWARPGQAKEALAVIENPSAEDYEREEAKEILSSDLEKTLEITEPVILDDKNPQRSSIREVIFRAFYLQIGKSKTLPDSVVVRLKKWVESNDEFVHSTAAVILAGFGFDTYRRSALDAARFDIGLLEPLLAGFIALKGSTPVSEAEASALCDLALASSREEGWGGITLIPKLKMSGTTDCILKGIQNTSDSEILYRFYYVLQQNLSSREEVLDILEAVTSGKDGGSAYFDLLMEIGQQYSEDREVTDRVRQALFATLQVCASSDYDSALRALEPVIREDDLFRILPFLDMPEVGCGGSVVSAAMELIDRIGSKPEIEERMISMLADQDHALQAARALARSGKPLALEVMIDKGVKRITDTSPENTDPGYFAPYGSRGEEALLGLIEYPSKATQRAVRLILARLQSERGHAIIAHEFAESLENGKGPSLTTVTALLYYGEDPWRQIMDFLMTHPGTCEGETYSDRLPEALLRSSVATIKQTLATETDAKRAAAIRCITYRYLWSDKATELLQQGADHSDPNIRAIFREEQEIDY